MLKSDELRKGIIFQKNRKSILLVMDEFFRRNTSLRGGVNDLSIMDRLDLERIIKEALEK